MLSDWTGHDCVHSSFPGFEIRAHPLSPTITISGRSLSLSSYASGDLFELDTILINWVSASDGCKKLWWASDLRTWTRPVWRSNWQVVLSPANAASSNEQKLNSRHHNKICSGDGVERQGRRGEREGGWQGGRGVGGYMWSHLTKDENLWMTKKNSVRHCTQLLLTSALLYDLDPRRTCGESHKSKKKRSVTTQSNESDFAIVLRHQSISTPLDRQDKTVLTESVSIDAAVSVIQLSGAECSYSCTTIFWRVFEYRRSCLPVTVRWLDLFSRTSGRRREIRRDVCQCVTSVMWFVFYDWFVLYLTMDMILRPIARWYKKLHVFSYKTSATRSSMSHVCSVNCLRAHSITCTGKELRTHEKLITEKNIHEMIGRIWITAF